MELLDLVRHDRPARVRAVACLFRQLPSSARRGPRMMPLPVLLAEAPARTFFELARLQTFTEWWQWLLLIVLCAAVGAFIVAMYVFDSRELSTGLTVLLVALRVLAFIGLLVFFFNLEKRSEKKIIKNSRAVVLID